MGGGITKGLEKLAWGIKGIKPPKSSGPTSAAKDASQTGRSGTGRKHSTPSLQIAPTRLTGCAVPQLFGRDKELDELNHWLIDEEMRVVVIVGPGGIGKSALVQRWREDLRLHGENPLKVQNAFDWPFRGDMTSGQYADAADVFWDAALRWFGDDHPEQGIAHEPARRLVQRLEDAGRTLLVLDNVESLQRSVGPEQGEFIDTNLRDFLVELADSDFEGLCVLTTQQPVNQLEGRNHVTQWSLDALSPHAGAQLLHTAGATKWGNQTLAPDEKVLQNASQRLGGHALTLDLLGRFIGKYREHVRVVNRVTLADVLHQQGNREGARCLFEEARGIDAGCEDPFPVSSVQGFKYYDFLLANAERETWVRWQNPTGFKTDSDYVGDCEKVLA